MATDMKDYIDSSDLLFDFLSHFYILLSGVFNCSFFKPNLYHVVSYNFCSINNS